ncbi:MAG: lytic transglycosylase [Deltaproteobacteria bacterium]|nr:MAG: lytic transglycosylase [Deltaproteobacteria bacterium]
MTRRINAYTFSCLFLSVLLTLLMAPTVRADIYKYKDKNGTLHFTNTRPATQKKFKVYIKEYKPEKSRFFSTTQYDKIISRAAKRHGVIFALIKSIIAVESGFNPRAISQKGAKGLMQIMPRNYRELGIRNPFDPHQNIMGGTNYLKRMIKRYNGQLKLAIAAYNAGPEAVDRYKGIPPFQETREYVKRVLHTLRIYESGKST